MENYLNILIIQVIESFHIVYPNRTCVFADNSTNFVCLVLLVRKIWANASSKNRQNKRHKKGISYHWLPFLMSTWPAVSSSLCNQHIKFLTSNRFTASENLVLFHTSITHYGEKENMFYQFRWSSPSTSVPQFLEGSEKSVTVLVIAIK